MKRQLEMYTHPHTWVYHSDTFLTKTHIKTHWCIQRQISRNVQIQEVLFSMQPYYITRKILLFTIVHICTILMSLIHNCIECNQFSYLHVEVNPLPLFFMFTEFLQKKCLYLSDQSMHLLLEMRISPPLFTSSFPLKQTTEPQSPCPPKHMLKPYLLLYIYTKFRSQ